MPKLWRHYDLSKLSQFVTRQGYRLRGHAITFKRFGIVFLWKEERGKYPPSKADLEMYDGV